MNTGGASRLAAARLERAQQRADAVGKRAQTSSSSYGAYWFGSPAAEKSSPPQQDNKYGGLVGSSAGGHGHGTPGVVRGKSMDFTNDLSALPLLGSEPSPPRPAAAAPATSMAEIGVPAVALTASDAFAWHSLEGAMHENHDRGATAILPDGTALFAALDGHGAEGASVSGFAVRNLLAGTAAMLAAGKPAAEAIQWAYSKTSGCMAQHVNDCRFSGSTAIVCALQRSAQGRVLTTGWVGDSRAVIGRARVTANASRQAANHVPVAVTKDHKPTDPKERQRLAECRAIVRPSRVINPHSGSWIEVGAVRVWDASQIYGVAMSRSLGDMQVHPFLIPTPEIASRNVDGNDKLLVIATDGVWDVMENEEAVHVAGASAPSAACKAMVDACARRWDTQMPGRRDDITSVVIDLTHADVA